MAKVTDIQDKNGVSKEIQDKDLSAQTTVTTVGSTDYVMLQDTNGAYHKILRSSFTDAIRDVLGPSIGGVAKGTDILKVPVLGTNDGLGFGTLANLASVLGETKVIPSEDFNNAIENGVYKAYSVNVVNGPVANLHMFVLLVCNYSPTDGITQTCLDLHAQTMYFRTKKQSEAWSSWHEVANDIPTFYKDYNSLSAFSDAIGAFCGFYISGDIKYLASVINYDEAPLGFAWGMSTASNRPPFTSAGGVVFTFCGPAGSESLRVQIAFDGASMYSRRKPVNDEWSSWTQL